jgi:hypothetical protein
MLGNAVYNEDIYPGLMFFRFLCLPHGILKNTKKHTISETGSLFVLR